MNTLWRHIGRFSFLILAILIAAPGPASANTLLDADFNFSGSGTGGTAVGWSSAVVSSSTSEGDYLMFPSGDALRKERGTLELRII